MKRPIIIKLGTESVVDKKNQTLRTEILDMVILGIAPHYHKGEKFLIISSGAIACGMNDPLVKLKETNQYDKQSLAAIGQAIMYGRWKEAINEKGIIAGEFLFTHRLLTEKETKDPVATSLRRFITNVGIPVCNELDCVCSEEIWNIVGGGDNDVLTLHIAKRLYPQLVVFMTGTDFVFHPLSKEPMEFISSWDIPFETLLAQHSNNGNGISSKVSAAMKIVRAIPDCRVVIVNFQAPRVVERILAGEKIGTLIASPDRRQ